MQRARESVKKFFQPLRSVNQFDPEYTGINAADYRRTLLQKGIFIPIMAGIIVFALAGYFIYLQFTECSVFCARLDGPSTAGHPHCDESLPVSASASDDGVVLNDKFVEKIVNIGRRVQKGNRVILSTVWLPEGFVWSVYFKPHTLVLNFLQHMQETMPDAYPLLVCTTEYTCQVLNSFRSQFTMQYYVLRDRSNYMCDVARYLERAVTVKYLYAYALLKYGRFDVLMTDIDTAFLQNPLTDIESLQPPADVMALSDSMDRDFTYWRMPRAERLASPWLHVPGCVNQYPVQEVNYCASTGLVYYRANERAESLVSDVLSFMIGDNPGWEQSRFNELLQPHITQHGLRFELFNALNYSNILWYLNLQHYNASMAVPVSQIVVAHAGYMNGPAEKIDGFKQMGLWKPGTVFPIKFT